MDEENVGMVEVADGMVVIMEVVMAMPDRAKDIIFLIGPPTKDCFSVPTRKNLKTLGVPRDIAIEA